MPKFDPKQTDTTVLNIVMLGTNEHRENKKTILTELANQIKIDPNQSIHLIDGPGAKSNKNDSKHPMIGTYDFSCKYDATTGEIHAEKPLRTSLAPGAAAWRWAKRIGGLIRGTGYNDAIDEAVQVVDAMVQAGKKPLVVNMYGFSRGGDTILRMSNIINSLYPKEDVKINILAIDPVPGFGRRKANKARLVPSNVKEYEAAWMDNERRSEFAAQDKTRISLQDPLNTHVRYHIYHGDHSHALQFQADETKTNDSSRLLWDDVQQFANRNGTKLNGGSLPYVKRESDTKGRKVFSTFENTHSLSGDAHDKQRFAWYNSMIDNEDEYKKLSRKKLGTPREFVNRKTDYFLHGTQFFQDKDHMQLFKKYYPNAFDYFFQKNKAGAAATDVINEINRMKQQDVNLVNILAKGVFPGIKADNLTLPKPQGVPVIADDLYENKELMFLWEAVQSVCHKVIAGYDTSVSKATANQLYDNVRKVLESEASGAEKISKINASIYQGIMQNKNSKLFAYKLVGIIGNSEINQAFLNQLKNEPAFKAKSGWVEKLNDLNGKVASITMSPITENEKRKLISDQVQLLQNWVKVQGKSPERKLLIDYTNAFLNYQKPNLVVADRMISSMSGYLNRFVWFGRDKELTQNSKNIADMTKNCLMELRAIDAGNNVAAITKIMDEALRGIRTVSGKKSEFEIKLRQNIMELTNYQQTNRAVNPQVEKVIQDFSGKIQSLIDEKKGIASRKTIAPQQEIQKKELPKSEPATTPKPSSTAQVLTQLSPNKSAQTAAINLSQQRNEQKKMVEDKTVLQKPVEIVAPKTNKENLVEVSQAVEKKSSIKSNNFHNKENLDLIAKVLESMHWKMGDRKNEETHSYHNVVDEKNNPKFAIHADKITTTEVDLNVFVAMLKSFQAIHGEAALPRITTDSPEAKHLLKEACERVYKNAGVEWEKVINLSAGKPVPEVPMDEKEEQSSPHFSP